jgi:hypothetical protein
VTAFNGYLAAPELADAVIEKMKKDRDGQKPVNSSAGTTPDPTRGDLSKRDSPQSSRPD